MGPDHLEITGLDPDSSLLVSGPPMTGKFDFLLGLLARHTDRSILVSTKYEASEVFDRFRAASGQSDRTDAVIDCVADPDANPRPDPTAPVRYVGSPRNLTRIGIEFTDLLDEFGTAPEGGHGGVAFHTLSSLVMQLEIKPVYQFLQVFFGQIRGTGWLGLAVIDTEGPGAEEAQLLHHHFDGLVETREGDRGREYRVRGLTPTTTEWRSF